MAADSTETAKPEMSPDALESQPLLQEWKSEIDDDSDLKPPGKFLDESAYEVENLASWRVFLVYAGSIWTSRILWLTMLKLGVFTLVAGVTTASALPYPASSYLHADKMLEVTKFLTVFVGLLLGFFLSSSLSRWHTCTQGVLELCDSIRNLQMQFLALGVPKDKIDLCCRYGLLSATLLRIQLVVETKPAHEMEETRRHLWNDLLASEEGHDQLGCTQKFTPKEFKAIRSCSDPPGLMWTWVTSLIARLAQDGLIPDMATPTYGRIMNLAQDAHGGIRNVRAAISVQAPFIYVHTLAYLVHVNNILYALCLGCIGGSTVGDTLHRDLPKYKHFRAETTKIINYEVFFVACFLCILGPLLYQAIMEIGLSLAQPFASTLAPVPVQRLLNLLEEDLIDSEVLALAPPYWTAPTYSNRPKKKLETQASPSGSPV